MAFDTREFKETAREALVASSTYIRNAILGNVDLSSHLEKGDKTAVTVTDRESQALALPIIERGLGKYRIDAEESPEASGSVHSLIHNYHDPLDGTTGYLVGGSNPTVILGAYDSSAKEILAAATMEPITGRFWLSFRDAGTTLARWDYGSKSWVSEGQFVQANRQPLKKGVVLVDVNHAFARENGQRPVLYAEGRRELSRGIEAAGAKELTFNTNGLHYALTATGRPTMVANITTAIGGPFDVIGLLHVVEAGGTAQAYRIEEKEGSRVLQPVGQDIETADMVIAANTMDNLLRLEDILRGASTHRS